MIIFEEDWKKAWNLWVLFVLQNTYPWREGRQSRWSPWAHARKGKQPRWMTIKRLRPTYRLARRPIINGMKIKSISLKSCTNIKSSVDEACGLLLRETPKTQVPNCQCHLGIERFNKISKTDCIWRFESCVLKSASFHKTWRLRPEVCVLTHTKKPRP